MAVVVTGARLAAQAENFTDACLVLRDGEILLEHYANGMGPDTPHLMNSCTKTLSLLSPKTVSVPKISSKRWWHSSSVFAM